MNCGCQSLQFEVCFMRSSRLEFVIWVLEYVLNGIFLCQLREEVHRFSFGAMPAQAGSFPACRLLQYVLLFACN